MPAHHHGAVVQRRLRIENAYQQIVAELRVKFDSAVDDIFQTDVALDHDQRTRLGGSKRGGRQDHFVVNALAKLSVMPSRERHAKAIAESDQRLPNLVLKENDDGHADVKQSAAQNKSKRSQILSDGEPVKEGKNSDGSGHGRGASSADEFQNCIHEQEDQNDIREIARFTKPCEVLRVWQ